TDLDNVPSAVSAGCSVGLTAEWPRSCGAIRSAKAGLLNRRITRINSAIPIPPATARPIASQSAAVTVPSVQQPTTRVVAQGGNKPPQPSCPQIARQDRPLTGKRLQLVVGWPAITTQPTVPQRPTVRHCQPMTEALRVQHV